MRAAIRSGVLGWTLNFKVDYPDPYFDSLNKNANDVLVQVSSAAINPIDYKIPRAMFGPIYGIDVSGEVIKVGSAVTEFSVGDAVFGASKGSLCETAISGVEGIAKKPESWTFSEVASLPVAYLTGLQGLRDVGAVTNGSSVLIIGASGGCGIAAIHIAKGLGATRIVGICSGKNRDFVHDAGATEIVDYTDSNALDSFFSTNSGKFDCVYDAATGSGAGENYTKKSMTVMTDKGQYVQINGGASVWGRKVLGMMKPRQNLILTKMKSEDLTTVTQLLDKIDAKPYLNPMNFSEEDVRKGFELLKSRRTKGKIVFEVK